MKNLRADKPLSLNYINANLTFKQKELKYNPIFSDITQNTLAYKHIESNFIDYDRDVLIKQKMSTQGPAMAVGDVNNDGLDDIYFGGAASQIKELYVQNKNGKFTLSKQPAFSSDVTTENTDAVFVDVDNDKDLDLVVVTGSNEFLENASELHDLMYLNDGKGNFQRNVYFPMILENGSCVVAADFNKDGFADIFIGSRMISAKYGLNPHSQLLINNKNGQFVDKIKEFVPESDNLGMITDAVAEDVNKDGYVDLILSQDWGEILVILNKNGKGFDKAQAIKNSGGKWNCIKAVDIDGDGDLDFIAGNMGENNKLYASDEFPATLNVNDFAKNGIVEQIISCKTENGKAYPMVLKGELQRALPMIKTKFIKYTDFANKTVSELFTEQQMEGMLEKKIQTTQTMLLINDGKGNFELKSLPMEAQFSVVAAIETGDFNRDGNIDILMAGNFYDNLPEWGRFDGNYGLFLKGMGKGNFVAEKPLESGFGTMGQVRKMLKLKSINNKELIVLAKNNDNAQVFKY